MSEIAKNVQQIPELHIGRPGVFRGNHRKESVRNVGTERNGQRLHVRIIGIESSAIIGGAEEEARDGPATKGGGREEPAAAEEMEGAAEVPIASFT